ncbi:MAG: hypothetical protein ABI333_25525 [bacterium]
MLLLTAAILLAWVIPSDASASPATGAGLEAPATSAPGVVVFFGRGEQIFDVGPLPKPYAKQKWLAGFRAGYRCKVLLLFWAYIHRWDCKPAVYQGKQYLKSELSTQSRGKTIEGIHAAIAKTYKPGDVKLSFWAKDGRYVLAGILGFLILLGIIRKLRK